MTMVEAAQRFRKKPVEVEAMRCSPENVEAVAAWCGGRVERISSSKDPSDEWVAMKIPTLEGVMTANTYNGGDWVIRGVKGEFYPCKPTSLRRRMSASETVSHDARGHPGAGEADLRRYFAS